jgi:meso-butanediol dehydrogenase / (S,S)-butanediol dehydrogenase / diacetyl reductase
MTESARTGQVVLLTGGGSGIAAETARLFASRGASVVLGDIAEERVTEVAAAIRSAGGDATAHVVDVTDDASVRAFVAKAVELHGGLDVVLPIAGVFVPPEAPITEITDAAIDLLINVNLRGVVYVLRAAIPHIRERGSVILTSSTSGLMSHPGGAVYSATKIGMIGLGRCLGMELAPRRIRVNMVCPGGVNTPLTRNAYPDNADEIIAEAAEMNPLGQFGEPSDIAEAFWFLASPNSRHVNGVSLRIDGGEALAGVL